MGCMTPLKPFLFSLLLIGAGPPDSGLVGLQQEDQRIADIAYRLQSANLALCRDASPLAGFSVHDLAQYAPQVRAEAQRTFGLDPAYPAVLSVARGSSAARAGLRAGDIVTQLNGVAVAAGRGAKASYDGVAAFNESLDTAVRKGVVTLTTKRKTISFTPERGCASRFEVVPGRRLNGGADGSIVQLTTGLLIFAGNDDAVATAMAHELAHNILRHRAFLDKNGRKAANVRMTETEADYWGMYLLIRAGYDGARAIDFWKRYEAKTNKGILADGTHPGAKERVAFVENTLREIRERQKAGEPLVPSGMVFNTKR
jgi:beta-barrel assembly-enhancing protease